MSSPSARSVRPARAALDESSSATSREDGKGVREPERHHLVAALELGEEEDLVDQLARVLDLGAGLFEQRRDVCVG